MPRSPVNFPELNHEEDRSMHVDGGCHCGNITYEAEIDEGKVVICHCEDCQRMSGAPYNAVAMVTESNFTLKTGALAEYVKTAESGNKRSQMFCSNCATRIYATAAETPPDGAEKIFGVRVGTINQRAELKPGRQAWHRSAQPWVNNLADIPAIETQ